MANEHIMGVSTPADVAATVVQKAYPTPGDVHVNALLTNLCVAYFQEARRFVAGQVFRNIPVDKQSNLYPIWNADDFNRNQMKKRAPATETAGGGIAPTYGNYSCDVYGFHVDFPDQLRANYDMQYRPDQAIAQFLAQVDLILREVTWMSTYFTTGVWGTDKTGGTDFTYWNDASSDPFYDIETAKNEMLEATGFEPNTMVLGKKVLSGLRLHPDIIDRVKYGQQANGAKPAKVTLENLQYLFEIDRILVSSAIQNTSAEGATASNSFIGGNHALLAYVNEGADILMPSAGYTFNWTGYLGAGQNGVRSKTFRLEAIASDRNEIESAWVQKLAASSLGYFFSGAIDPTLATSSR